MKNGPSSGILNHYGRVFLTLLILIFVTVFSLVTAARSPTEESYRTNWCQRLLTPINFRLRDSFPRRTELVNKVPSFFSREMWRSFSVYYRNGFVEFEINPKKTGGYLAIAIEEDPLMWESLGFKLLTTITGKTVIRVPGTQLLNYNLDRQGITYSKPFRFKDWFGKTAQTGDQYYSVSEFLNEIALGNILLATKSKMLIHDRAADHIVGILNMPPKTFLAYQERVKKYLIERNNADVANKELIAVLDKIQQQLMYEWDSYTGVAGVHATRPEEYFYNRELTCRTSEECYSLIANGDHNYAPLIEKLEELTGK
jgi:hypothetical protein